MLKNIIIGISMFCVSSVFASPMTNKPVPEQPKQNYPEIHTSCFKNLTELLEQASKKGYVSLISSLNKPELDKADAMISILFNKKNETMAVIITKVDGASCVLATGYGTVANGEELVNIFTKKANL